MSKYIDVDKIISYLNDEIEECGDCDVYSQPVVYGTRLGLEYSKSLVETAETVDVVQVVRCKDCVVPHNQWTGCPKLNGLVTPPDFYCGYAERRKESSIVRCKDCIHRDPEDKKCDCSFQARGGIFPMDDDDFCSCGESR